MLFWLIKEAKGKSVEDEKQQSLWMSECTAALGNTDIPESILQSARPHLVALRQPHQSALWCRHLLLCSFLPLPFISSSLSMPVSHLLPHVNKFDQADMGKLLFGCCSSALWQILDSASSSSLLLPSHLSFLYASSAATTATRSLSNSPGEVGRALPCHPVTQNKDRSLRCSRATAVLEFQNAHFRFNPLSDFLSETACRTWQASCSWILRNAGIFPKFISRHVQESLALTQFRAEWECRGEGIV